MTELLLFIYFNPCQNRNSLIIDIKYLINFHFGKSGLLVRYYFIKKKNHLTFFFY